MLTFLTANFASSYSHLHFSHTMSTLSKLKGLFNGLFIENDFALSSMLRFETPQTLVLEINLSFFVLDKVLKIFEFDLFW